MLCCAARATCGLGQDKLLKLDLHCKVIFDAAWLCCQTVSSNKWLAADLHLHNHLAKQ